jgi:hypothetical protein
VDRATLEGGRVHVVIFVIWSSFSCVNGFIIYLRVQRVGGSESLPTEKGWSYFGVSAKCGRYDLVPTGPCLIIVINLKIPSESL